MTDSQPANNQGSLSRERIVGGALSLIKSVGVEGLTMRRLADEFGVTPMSLYYHVKNKDHLLQLVADAVLAAVEIPSRESAPWDQRIRLIVERIRSTANQYPGVGAYLLGTFQSVIPRREVGLEMIRILLEAGFDEDQTAYAIATIYTLELGRFRIEAAPPVKRRKSKSRQARVESDPVGGVQAKLEKAAGDDFFERSLDTVLAGLRRELVPTKV